MTEPPKEKKAKVDEATIDRAWEHFRNYLDDDTVDELQELLSLIPPPSKKKKKKANEQEQKPQQGAATTTKKTMQSRQDLLPLLLSTACMGIADESMSAYFAIASSADDDGSSNNTPMSQNNNNVEEAAAAADSTMPSTTAMLDELRAVICRYVAQSLEYYPDNAMTYSLAANFARTYGCCASPGGGAAPNQTARWYLKAATSSQELRRLAIAAIEDKENPPSDDLKEWLEVLVLNHVCGVDRTCTALLASSSEGDEEGDDDEVDETTMSWSPSAVESTARFMAAMLLSTSNQHDEAAQQLRYFPDLSHRIHPNVWRGSTTTSTSNHVAEPCPVSYATPVLPPALYAQLCRVFDKDASYWVESDYEARGYYSYFVDLPKNDVPNDTPTNAIEDAVVNHLLPRVRAHLGNDTGSKIVGYEWWVHTRPVGASLGHNLHFDTDESKLETAADGSISHPYMSSVLYLTAPPVSGATIVFQQSPEATDNAQVVWISQPVDNSMMVFPGNLLHGVLPCRATGTSEATAAAAGISDDDDETLKDSLLEACGKPLSADAAKHRLSFMVGFWTRRVPDEMKNRLLYGPCGPLPSRNEADWVKELQEGYGSKTTKAGDAVDVFAAPTPLPFITPAWEAINENALSEGNMEEGLEVPRAIDHRFFVADAPRCFRESLFEPEEDDDDDDACIMAIDEDDEEEDASGEEED